MKHAEDYSPGTRYHPHKPNAYSARHLRKPVAFTCLARDAKEVFVAGDFNGWEAKAHPMQRLLDGAWRAEILLPHGHHRYVFVVDGRPTLDPNAQGVARDDQGQRVSLVAVS